LFVDEACSDWCAGKAALERHEPGARWELVLFEAEPLAPC
jgi:hypothetical protein